MTGSVFISHSSRDATLAHDLVAALEAAGIACWISGRDVAPGANYQESIVAAIRGGRAMVVLVSEAANASDEVKKELSLASAAGVAVYPVRLGTVTPNPALSYELATRQWIEGGEVAVLAQRLAAAIQGSAPHAPAPAPDAPAPLALPDKPSLVVLPFQNMSGDPEQEYFADGIVDDLTTALSRTGWLFVIARNSAFTYKGRAVNVPQVGRELGVRYVLEGSVRRAGGRVRITCQLIEAATGGHVWANRFDGDLADIFVLQDEVTESVVGALEPSLLRTEIARATSKPPLSLDAYDLYLRAIPPFMAMTRDGLDAAVAFLRQALQIDPDYGRATGLLAMVYNMRVDQGWGEPGDRAAAISLAGQTLASGTDDPEALRCAAFTLFFAGDAPAALTVLDRALRLHSNSAQVLAYSGFAHSRANDPDNGIRFLERAMRLSPLDPDIGSMHGGLGIAHLMLGHDVEGLAWLQRAVHEIPNTVWVYRFLILAQARNGRHEEARASVARLLQINPDHRVGARDDAYFNPQFNEERRQALLAAGLPE